MIFVIILIAQIVLHMQLGDQKNSGMEVQVAARQRMLVQEISKLTLDIALRKQEDKSYKESLTDLKKTRQKWVDSHIALTQGSEAYQISGEKSLEVQEIVRDLNPIFMSLKKEVDAILSKPDEEFETHLANVTALDDQYAELSKRLGYRFSQEKEAKFKQLYQWSWIFSIGTVIVLLLAFFIIIRPLLARLYNQNAELLDLNDHLEKASKVKSDFLANMSHEIRTPMNGILGTAGFLSKTKLDREQKKYLSTIKTSSENLMIIINDILDYSKLDQEKMQLENEPFLLQQSMDEVMELLKPSAQDKGIELIAYVEEQIPSRLIGDVVRLKQVLINLVNNAIKFTESGEVYVEASLKALESDFAQINFMVRDTGIGIPEEKLEGLFESFTQADTSTTRRFGGTGLGLAICKNLVSLMGGKIWVESEKGKGSKFQFSVVLEAASADQKIIDTEILQGKKALVVDDNNTNLRILVKQLGSWGVRSTPFNSPELVQELIKDLKKFDFCVMDMQMPNMDGAQLSRIIRDHYSKEELPIVVLSSTGELLVAEDEIFNSYLTKPVKPGKLKSTLLNILDNQSPFQNSAIAEGPAGSTMSSLKILIADNNDINLAVTSKILENMGYNSEKAHSGHEVVQKVNKSWYDLILMDVDMPGLTGFEATKKIKSMYLDNSEAPVIIALLGHDSKQDRKKCLNQGMDDLITKPLEETELSTKIEEWFDVDSYL